MTQLGPDQGAADGLRAPLAAAPAQVFRGVVRVAIVVVVLQSVLHLVDVGLGLRIERLDAGSDSSVWSWAGSGAQLLAALGAGLLLVVPGTRAWPVRLLVAALLFFSLDDAVQVHEQLSHVLEGSGTAQILPPRMVWPLLYLPLMLATCLLLWGAGTGMAATCRRATRVGLALLGVAVLLEFGVGLVGLEAGESSFDSGVISMPYEVEVVVEEGLELAGWLVIAAALLSTSLDRLLRLRPGAPPSPRR